MQHRRQFAAKKVLSFIAFWLCWEWIHLNWEISWPWLTLGNAFASQISLIQWYEYTGVFGGGLWILVINCLIFHTWKTRSFISKKELQHKLTTICTIISVPILISLIIYFSYEEKGEPVEIAIIQPNYEPHYEKFEVPEEVQLSRFIRLTLNAITDKTKYILWPETELRVREQLRTE